MKTHTHKKASSGILAKDTGKAPDKLLLFSLLLSLHDNNHTIKKIIQIFTLKRINTHKKTTLGCYEENSNQLKNKFFKKKLKKFIL